MSGDFLARLRAGEIFVSDGAMGSLLMARGLPSGHPPEEWNLSRPEILEEVAALYLEAGAQIIQSNSFGGSPLKLARYGLQERCAEINRRAAEIARRAAGKGAWVAGSVGPCGGMLTPYGELSAEEVVEGFRSQIAALAEGGADLILIETMTDLEEALLALQAARLAAPGLPALVTMTFDATPRGFFTLMGQELSETASRLAEAGADALGSNCGNGAAVMLRIAQAYVGVCSLPLIFQPNAGLPELADGRVVYRETPEFMASLAVEMIACGARIVGGCCGSTPAHTTALRRAVDGQAGH